MAYDASNNKQTEEENVAGAKPLGSTGASAPQMETQQDSAPTPTNVGQSSLEAQTDQQGPSRSTPKASSGRFTNIQKYVEKNRPQAQKLSQAVSQDVGQQAQEIRQATEQKQAQTQQKLQANQQVLDQQRQFAQQQVNQALQGQQAGQEDVQRVQQLAQGQVQGLQAVQPFDLSQEQARAQALQNLAGNVRTEQGRRNLLTQTFQDQGDYSRGLAGLDQLILSGDDQARTGLIQGIEGQTADLQQALRNIQAQTRAGIAGEQQARQQLGQDITSQITSGLEGVDTDIDTAYEQELARRQALLADDGLLQQTLAGGDQLIQDRLALLQGGNYANLLREVLPEARRIAQERGIRESDFYEEGIDNYIRSLASGGKGDTFTTASTSDNDMVSHHKHRQSIRALMDAVGARLGLPDVYGTQQLGTSFGGNNQAYIDALRSLPQYYKNQLSNVNVQDLVGTDIESQLGTSLDDLRAGADLQRLDVAGDENIARFNALKNLLGQSDVITEQSYDDYVSAEELEELLGKYNV